jgi:hypothetical protein
LVLEAQQALLAQQDKVEMETLQLLVASLQLVVAAVVDFADHQEIGMVETGVLVAAVVGLIHQAMELLGQGIHLL